MNNVKPPEINEMKLFLMNVLPVCLDKLGVEKKHIGEKSIQCANVLYNFLNTKEEIKELREQVALLTKKIERGTVVPQNQEREEYK